MHRCSHPMHSFSTSTILVQLLRMTLIFTVIASTFSSHERSAHRTNAAGPEENSGYFRFFLSGRAKS